MSTAYYQFLYFVVVTIEQWTGLPWAQLTAPNFQLKAEIPWAQLPAPACYDETDYWEMSEYHSGQGGFTQETIGKQLE